MHNIHVYNVHLTYRSFYLFDLLTLDTFTSNNIVFSSLYFVCHVCGRRI